jgi:sugar lactone lactonase YvrE
MRWTVIPMLVLCGYAYAAQVIELVAGGGAGGDGAKATEAKLVGPFSTDFDKDGNMYIAEMYGNRLCKVDAKGVLHVVSGDGTKAYGGDGGPSKAAKISGPHNAIVAPNGDVYIADTWNHRVRKIDGKTGVITTVAGSGKKGFSGDGGPAIAADFNETYCVALSPNAETLYIVDLGNKRVRAMDLKTGVVHTIAGNGVKGIPSDGADAKTSPLNDPRAVCADKIGNVFILERGGSTLRRLDSNGKLHLLAGTNKPGSGGDGGPSLQASLKGPKFICMDLDDNVLIADSDNHLVRKVFVKEMKIERIAGTGKMANGPVDGSPLACDLNKPHGVYVHPDGTIYIADSDNNRVLKIKR